MNGEREELQIHELRKARHRVRGKGNNRGYIDSMGSGTGYIDRGCIDIDYMDSMGICIGYIERIL